MSGAGIRGGQVLGSSDDFGLGPQENPYTVVHDVNATILRLIGIDHLKLTYLYQTRDSRLTDVHGDGCLTVLGVTAGDHIAGLGRIQMRADGGFQS
jgi:Protein of unknown function (DUF1501)